MTSAFLPPGIHLAFDGLALGEVILVGRNGVLRGLNKSRCHEGIAVVGLLASVVSFHCSLPRCVVLLLIGGYRGKVVRSI